MKQEKRIIGSVGMHISNSGASISIIDEGFGPTIEINTSAFGNIDTTTKIITDKQSLLALAKLFMKASDFEFSKDYCEKASVNK